MFLLFGVLSNDFCLTAMVRGARAGRRGRGRRGRGNGGFVVANVTPTSVLIDTQAFVISAGTIGTPSIVTVDWSSLPITSALFASATFRVSNIKFEMLATGAPPGIVDCVVSDFTGTVKNESRDLMVGNSSPTRILLRVPKSTDFGPVTGGNTLYLVQNQGGAVTGTALITVAFRTA